MLDIKQALRLCLVIGPSNVMGDWLAVVKAAVMGGVTMVQLREKQTSAAELVAYAQVLQKILPPDVPLIINDCVEAAKHLQLGLHIGQRDCGYSRARKELGEEVTIGLSIENRQQALQFKDCGADYFGIGPVFATASKYDAAPALGVEEACVIASILSPMRSVFIGGINHTNVAALRVCGGLAVISAITNSANPAMAAKQLRGE